jgi:acyl-CoA reductase-like NAD-dependent aldehyde dehydrogenase
MSLYTLWIDGKPVKGASAFNVINPATENIFANISCSNFALVDEAIESAKAAQNLLRNMSISQRQLALNKLADGINVRAEELAEVITQEQGKPLSEARDEVVWAESFIRYFSTLDLPVETMIDTDDKQVELHRVPLGVVACIIPWNFPLNMIAIKVPQAILTGNSCVIKPSPHTPVSAAIFAEICAEVLPPGTVNTVNDQNDLGEYLIQHPGIAKVSFTGSTSTGKKIMAGASGTLKRLTLELGGNDAAIVLSDVDIKDTAKKIFDAAFMNCGQVCIAVKRVYAHESIYEKLCAELASHAESTVVGNGFDSGVQIGPVCNKMQYEKVLTFIDGARKAGTIVCGGYSLKGNGYFIRPTIVKDVKDGDEIVDKEQFGPVLPIISFSNIAEAIANANRLEMGLGGSVWSKDLDKAMEISKQIEAGTVWINTHGDVDPGVPFGGVKQSGFGVEFGSEGLHEYTQIKVIHQAK